MIIYKFKQTVNTVNTNILEFSRTPIYLPIYNRSTRNATILMEIES